MIVLKRTSLRHKLLASVAAGRMAVVRGNQWNLVRLESPAACDRDAEWLQGPERRAANDIRPYVAHTPARSMVQTDAWLNEDGSRLLAEWNAQFGEMNL